VVVVAKREVEIKVLVLQLQHRRGVVVVVLTHIRDGPGLLHHALDLVVVGEYFASRVVNILEAMRLKDEVKTNNSVPQQTRSRVVLQE